MREVFQQAPRIIEFRDLFKVIALFVLIINMGVIKNADFVKELDKDFWLSSVLYFIVLVVAYIMFIIPKRPQMKKDHFFIISLLLFLLYTNFDSGLRGTDDDVTQKRIFVFTVSSGFGGLAPWIIFSTKTDFQSFFRLTSLLGICVAISGIWTAMLAPEWQFVGPFGSKGYHSLGRMAGISSVFLLAALLHSESIRKSAEFAFFLSITLFACLLSGARQAWIGLFFSAVYLAIQAIHVRKKVFRLFTTAAALALILGIFMVFSDAIGIRWEVVRYRMPFISEGDISDPWVALKKSARPDLWRAAAKLWGENPVLGAGLGVYKLQSGTGHDYPHNILLEIASEMGIVGLAIWTLLMSSPTRLLLSRNRHDDYISSGLAAGGLFFFVCSLFSGSLASISHLITMCSIYVLYASNKEIP